MEILLQFVLFVWVGMFCTVGLISLTAYALNERGSEQRRYGAITFFAMLVFPVTLIVFILWVLYKTVMFFVNMAREAMGLEERLWKF